MRIITVSSFATKESMSDRKPYLITSSMKPLWQLASSSFHSIDIQFHQ